MRVRVRVPAPLLRQKHPRSSEMLLGVQVKVDRATRGGARAAVAVGMRAAIGALT